jgi:ADP-ribosylglycohydrolase
MRNRLAAEVIALTHGDPEAFISGAALVHGLSLLLHRPDMDLDALLRDTMDAIALQFGKDYLHTGKLWELLQLARTLASSEHIAPMEAMERLGCRSSAEILAGALYACLTCHGDFDTALITAVNHSGRSAAVGAITGAVLGAVMGRKATPDFYLDSLEPTPYLLELADDLHRGCPMETSGLYDADWDRKYVHGGR